MTTITNVTRDGDKFVLKGGVAGGEQGEVGREVRKVSVIRLSDVAPCEHYWSQWPLTLDELRAVHPLAPEVLRLLQGRGEFDMVDLTCWLGTPSSPAGRKAYYTVAQDVCCLLAQQGVLIELRAPRFDGRGDKRRVRWGFGGLYRLRPGFGGPA